jgi:hypothetical protein
VTDAKLITDFAYNKKQNVFAALLTILLLSTWSQRCKQKRRKMSCSSVNFYEHSHDFSCIREKNYTNSNPYINFFLNGNYGAKLHSTFIKKETGTLTKGWLAEN